MKKGRGRGVYEWKYREVFLTVLTPDCLEHVSHYSARLNETRLEKEVYIKEYTIVPDFTKLGFDLMAFTFISYEKGLTGEQYDKAEKAAGEYEDRGCRARVLTAKALLMIAVGMGLGFDRVVVTFHKNYSGFVETVNALEQFPSAVIAHTESFLVSLAGEEHYQPLTFLAITKYLSMRKKK